MIFDGGQGVLTLFIVGNYTERSFSKICYGSFKVAFI